MSLETTLTLLLAAGLLLGAGLIWLFIRGLVYSIRYLQRKAAPARREKPQQPIFERIARRAGIVSGVLIRGGRIIVTLVQFAAAHIYAQVREIRTRLQNRRSLDGIGSPALFPGTEILLHPKSPYLPPRLARARSGSDRGSQA